MTKITLEALHAYRYDRIKENLTAYIPDFGLCILVDNLECLPKDRKTRYCGSDIDDTGLSTGLDVYSTDDPGEYMQFAVRI